MSNTYTFSFEEQAQKRFNKLDHPTKQRLRKFINDNLVDTDNPRAKGKQLGGPLSPYWRYRIGKYRLVVEIEDDRLTVVAVKVGHRSNIYR